MDTRTVIQKIQAAAQADSANMLSSTGGPSWLGRSSSLQPQINSAIHEWVHKENPEPLLGVIELLRTVDALSEQEANDLRDAIEQ
jgi:hypothetical protein